MTSSRISTIPTADPSAYPAAIVEGPGFRITVLGSCLLRLEHSADNRFVDRPTQLVRNRRFEVPDFTVADTNDSLDLWTSHLHLHYDQQPFHPAGLSVNMRQRAQDSHYTTWHFGDPPFRPDRRDSNLGGTLRTLDDVDGAVALEPGLLSHRGYAVVDDSASLLLTDEGWVEPRPGPGTDLYFFGYGRDHQAALRDFFALTGPNPLLPRWALGNWWSRFHRYTADEYLDMVDRFTASGVPFSVGVLDMDWHLVDIDPALGTGWTGYTWNTDLFPDPAGFLRELHERGLRVSLNVHPADGVRRHEAAYPAMARELGLDPDRGLEISFDVTSREFVDAYFRHLHHPHERIGVDLWWLDWQSGAFSRVPGLDPLWMLNQLHYLDSGRDGRRPLTFSRYAGLGSHRYPFGFSGDTVATWDSLDFQPYFTATAANVGYHWWSHDIGGHLGGGRDDELAVRWLQFGVFSPINRLHSVKNPFNSKEPWHYGRDAEQVMTRYLRLRHQLVPYLYTAMWASHTDGVAPIRPMYHDYPLDRPAYQVPNQYLFGADLLVAPITSPADPVTAHAETSAWLPDGTWFDVLTGHRYDGGRTVALYRTLDDIPVLAPAGAVLPLALDPMAEVSDDPDELLVKVFAGAACDYSLVEDDGSAEPDASGRRETRFSFRWRTGHDGSEADLRIDGAPGRRHLVVELIGLTAGDAVLTVAGARQVVALVAGDVGTSVTADLGWVDPAADLHVRFTGVRTAPANLHDRIFAVLDRARIAYELKTAALELAERLDGAALLAGLATLTLPGNLWGVLAEIVSVDDRTIGPPAMSMLDYWLDHRLPDDLRQRVTSIPSAATRVAVDSRQSYLALDWLVRTWLPAWLDLEMPVPEEATQLRELEPIADPAAAERAAPVVRNAQRHAEAQWEHIEYMIWIRDGETVTEVLREAAEEGAANTGAVAFMEVAQIVASDMARDAAYTGAYPAASAAARATARLGSGADENAIRAAATAGLASTVRRLQESACDLYREMMSLTPPA